MCGGKEGTYGGIGVAKTLWEISEAVVREGNEVEIDLENERGTTIT